MKPAWVVIGVAVAGCLAAGSTGLVFGQPDPAPAPLAPDAIVTSTGLSAPLAGSTPAATPVKELPPVLPSGADPIPPQPVLPGELPAPSRLPLVNPALIPGAAVPAQPAKAAHPAQTPVAPVQPQASTDGSAPADGPVARQESAVSLEWAGPAFIRFRQPAVYKVVARNNSGAAVHNVVVRHRIPDGVRFVGSDPRAVKEGDTVSWDLGTMQAGQEKTIHLQIIPDTKTALNCQATVTFTGTASLKVQVREPLLVLKVTSPEHVVLGDAVTVALTVSNPGDGPVERVKVKAMVPDGLEHVRGKVIEVELGNLLAGEKRTVQLVCATRGAGPQAMQCLAEADAGLSAQDTAKIDVVLPRLDLAVNGPRLRYLDRHATYTIKVTNPGIAPASNVALSHQLPSGFKFQAASSGGRYEAATRTVTWFVGDLPSGDSREVSVEVIAVNLGEHKHRVTATAARGLKAESELTTAVEGLSALQIDVSDTDDPVEVGTEMAYDIRVANTGSKMETNLELACTLPDKMEFRGARSAAGCKFRVEGREVIFEALPQLAPRSEATYRIMVRGVVPGDVRFRARVRADGLAEPVLREEATKIYGDER
jgi:uncharacterized repeat protein (TIGR01451 family)